MRGACAPAPGFQDLQAAILRQAAELDGAGAEDSQVPPDWLREVHGRHPNATAYVAGYLQAHLALGVHAWPGRDAFMAAFDHWAETGRLLTLQTTTTPAEELVERAEDLVAGMVARVAGAAGGVVDE